MQGRLSVDWMQQTDERVLEYLQSEAWEDPEEMANQPVFGIGAGMIQERCRILASVDFVAFRWGDERLIELTTAMALYVNGQMNANLREPSRDALRGRKSLDLIASAQLTSYRVMQLSNGPD